MEQQQAIPLIIAPANEDDADGAYRCFNEFFLNYQSSLTRVEYYLEEVMLMVDDGFAQAYKTWHKAIKELLRGVYLVVKKIPLPDADALLEALQILSFESAAKFLQDILVSCKMIADKENEWSQKFFQNIQSLMLAHQAILKTQAVSISR